MRCVCAKSAMHQRSVSLSCHPHGRARELAKTPEFAHAQRQRKKVEALFAELKHQIGLSRLRLRRLKFVREQFSLAAAAQNLKRLVRFLSLPITPVLPSHHLVEPKEEELSSRLLAAETMFCLTDFFNTHGI